MEEVRSFDVIERIIAHRMGVADAHAETFAWLHKNCKAKHVNAIESIPWEMDEDAFNEVLQSLVEKEPFPLNCNGLYFQVPDIPWNDPQIEIVGVADYGNPDEWGCEPVYPADEELLDEAAGFVEEFETILKALGLRLDDPAESLVDELEDVLYIVPLAFTAVTILHALPAAASLLGIGRDRASIGVGMGFSGGEMFTIGDLMSNGWGPPPKSIITS